MPLIKSAKKKLRQDKKRTARNKTIENKLKTFIKRAKKDRSEKAVKEATKAADKAAKHHVIHKNKAARIKSSLSKLIKKTMPANSKKSSSTSRKTAK